MGRWITTLPSTASRPSVDAEPYVSVWTIRTKSSILMRMEALDIVPRTWRCEHLNIQRSRLLLIDGLILGSIATLQVILDLVAYLFGLGPTGQALQDNLDAIGYVEAHGLAAILALLFILHRTDSWRGWHAVAAGTHALLGICNLIFWPIFVTWGLVPAGVAATFAHSVFFVLQTRAFARTRAMTTHRKEIP